MAVPAVRADHSVDARLRRLAAAPDRLAAVGSTPVAVTDQTVTAAARADAATGSEKRPAVHGDDVADRLFFGARRRYDTRRLGGIGPLLRPGP